MNADERGLDGLAGMAVELGGSGAAQGATAAKKTLEEAPAALSHVFDSIWVGRNWVPPKINHARFGLGDIVSTVLGRSSPRP
jgi:hypothetical protein